MRTKRQPLLGNAKPGNVLTLEAKDHVAIITEVDTFTVRAMLYVNGVKTEKELFYNKRFGIVIKVEPNELNSNYWKYKIVTKQVSHEQALKLLEEL